MPPPCFPLLRFLPDCKQGHACPIWRRHSLFHPGNTDLIDPVIKVANEVVIRDALRNDLVLLQFIPATSTDWDLARRTEKSFLGTSSRKYGLLGNKASLCLEEFLILRSSDSAKNFRLLV